MTTKLKTLSEFAGFLLLISALISGCGEKMSNSNGGDGSRLTAADLARLTDFHAWNVSIPEAQQPVKAIRLVVYNRGESTVTQEFSTGDNLGTNCISFLLGLRAEHGRLTGQLLTKNSNTSGINGAGWPLDFANPFEHPDPGTSVGWTVPGTLIWNGNRADFATCSQSNRFSALAVELEK